ncbi:secreted RxLR effector peptide protein, putative [Phytophthora infestans T30-4]|uniref:Secreted RxLR effector peptide protein, putative n=1 Tax=Phytophthora infestans (strain T30-4) TaxID=403677 RepID=D0NJM9_PHYIT|nr:secreted RxLR effector peptide protein, putative [Phytophthora infestans T30-4]EEY59965.1 secreted RxLR effector peptide protein, putative [Phytophthora infestans T30-4]|eukprot:XP_002900650.1 secreted RxLR effector peptide protein, putative [Phytophthora infestans T30-4]
MGPQCVMAVLVLLIFALQSNTGFGQTDFVLPNKRITTHEDAAEAISRRYLRSTSAQTSKASTGAQSEEERAQAKRMSAFTEKLAYKLALSLKMNPEIFFTGIRFSETVGKLNHSPEFMDWLRYVLKLRRKMGETSFSDAKFASLLRNAKPDEEILELLHAVRRVKGMKNLVDQLQTHLFQIYPSIHNMMNQAWLNSRESPKELFSLLLPPTGFQDPYLI